MSFDNFIDKSLVFFEKPLEKLTNQTVSLYHGSFEDIHNKLIPMGVNVGATKFSKPRWSCYYFDNFYSAMQWSVAWAVQKYAQVGVMYHPTVKKYEGGLLLKNNLGISNDELKKRIVDLKIITYVYEIKIKANDIEMGSVPSIKEYVVSKPMPIYKKHKILVTDKIIDKFFNIVDSEEWTKASKLHTFKNLKYTRGPILNRILDNHRDPYRKMIRNDLTDGTIKHGDDLSKYKKMINYGVKHDLLELNKENSIGMNIDKELMNLLEDCIYQEGLIKKFKDKRATAKREKILRDRRELRKKLTELPKELESALEQARISLKEEYSFEGVHEIMVEALFKAQAAIRLANILEPEEVAGAKNFLAMYEPTRKRIIQMVKQRSQQPEDFPGRCEQSMDIIINTSTQTVKRDYGDMEVNSEKYDIENIVKEYNKVMAERQHLTDN